MKLMSVVKFAERMGVSHTLIQNAIKDGRIPAKALSRTGSGLVKIKDPDLAEKHMRMSTAQKADGKVVTDDDVAGGRSTGPTYAQSRAIKEAYAARMAKIEYEEKAGKLVDANKVKVAAFNTARQVRDALLNIPNRVSAELASLTDPFDIEQRLTAEINQCLEELSKAVAKAGGGNAG